MKHIKSLFLLLIPALALSGCAARPAAATVSARVIDPTRPMLALTFDDGPSKYTDSILDVLAAVGGKATFCLIGNQIDNFPETVKRAAAEGHELAIHTWDHKELTALKSRDICTELSKTKDKITEVCGIVPRVLRPSYGLVNDKIKAVAADMDLVIVNWSVDTLDWKTKNPKSTVNAILRGAADGAIVLCHDLYGATAEAMKAVIPQLIEEGYQLVTVSELLSYNATEVKAGNLYRKGGARKTDSSISAPQ